MDISQFDLHAKIEDVHWWFKARREIMIDLLKRYCYTCKSWSHFIAYSSCTCFYVEPA